MIAEKLLLHVLIVLAPVLLFSFLPENHKVRKNNFSLGMLLGGSAFLSIAFSYQSLGFYWDLRFVPLSLALLYLGIRPGVAVIIVILLTRSWMGGETVLYCYFSSLFAGVLPFLLRNRFMSLPPSKRIAAATLSICWPILVAFMTFVLFHVFRGKHIDPGLLFSPDIVLVGIINIVAMGFAAMLIEQIIERKKMREEIFRAEKLNTMGELAASFAHEIRNPLTVVKGFIQLLHQKEQGENREYLTLVLSEIGRTEMIISDYLNFAKPQFQKTEECSFQSVLSELISLLEPLAAKEGVSLLTDFTSEELYIFTDKNQLKQAIVNFAKNAIEASAAGGNVLVSLRRDKEDAVIEIIDNGRGMNEEQLSRIGTFFYTTKEKGTGLGTCVSLRIIGEMNGTARYKSEPEKGTNVILNFPLRKKNSCSFQQRFLTLANETRN